MTPEHGRECDLPGHVGCKWNAIVGWIHSWPDPYPVGTRAPMSEPTPVEAGPVEALVAWALDEGSYDLIRAVDRLAPPCGTCRGRGVSTPGGYDDLPPASPCPACSGSGRDMSRVRLADAAPKLREALIAFVGEEENDYECWYDQRGEPHACDGGECPRCVAFAALSFARSALQEVNP